MLSSDLVRAVLDSAPDAMIIIDASGRILFANHQTTALFGHPRDNLVGQPVELLLPHRFRERHGSHRHQYSENVRVRPMGVGLELYALRADGTEFPVEISLSPIEQTERGPLVAAAVRDVSERKRTEKALQEAREEAERANHAKSRFLAMASHDLRQPLQALALLNGSLRRLTDEQDRLDALEQQEQAINAMSRLLNALLDISKLESSASKPSITEFRVSSLFDELRTEFAQLARNKGLELQMVPTAECAHSDPALIGQVLRNLISNAIKYTDRGSVRVVCERRGHLLNIEVSDTGIGIPKDQLALIYDEFYQVGVGPNTSRDGYGLGLSIVQRIVKLLGLRIEARSEIGKGSAFSLSLPAAQNASAAASSVRHASAATASCGGHVLLIEDEPGVRNATRMLLKAEGYRVTAAATLDDAINQARAQPDIDLIVSDYHLAGGQLGTQAIAAVRDILNRPLKAILVTGDTSSAVREIQHDANLRIASKPVNADELLALVKDLLESSARK